MTEEAFRILLVEDEPAHAEAIRRAIRDGGSPAVVEIVATLADYRRIVASSPPDIVLMDMNLPDGCAADLLVTPADPRQCPIVVMTSFGNEQVAVEAMKAGAVDYIVKSPDAFAAMPRTIERALHGWRLLQQRRQVEEALRQSEERLRMLVENVGEGVALVDADERFVVANPAAHRIFGVDPGGLVGQSLRRFTGEGHSALVREDARTLDLGASGSYTLDITTGDGVPRTLGVTMTPQTDAAGTLVGAFGVFHDITAQRRAEADRHHLDQQIQQSQKLESLGVLAGGIAHDFNNILMAVIGHADLALEQISPMSPARDNLIEIATAGRRAAELCRQMLAYSGRASFVVERVDVCELVEEITHLLKTSISKKAELALHLGRGLRCVLADPSQIRQVVMNLIINASDAIGDQPGTITVSTRERWCRAEDLRSDEWLEELPAGRYLEIEVADTGCGMDAETRSRIFEPFFTTKFLGRGLGLAAVSGIVRAHHGALKVESVPGEGSRFTLRFPTVPEADACAGDHGDSAASEWRGHGTVLFVDDEEPLRMLGARMLERLGMTVLTASDGCDAVARYRERGAEIDLVILDLTMPRMDGAEALAELRRLNPDVRVILASGYSEDDVLARCPGRGPTGVVQKPYTIGLLRDALRRAEA